MSASSDRLQVRKMSRHLICAAILTLIGAPVTYAAGQSDLGTCPTERKAKVLLPDGVWSCACPAVDPARAPPIVGSGIYALVGSDICAAAVHAGLLKAGSTGTVTFEKVDSPSSFEGSTQNGLTSKARPLVEIGAFRFPSPSVPGGVQSGSPAKPPPSGPAACPTDNKDKFVLTGRINCACGSVDPSKALPVYGSQIYALGKSDICTAAVHAGVLKPGTSGTVSLELVASLRFFEGTVQNGVTSLAYDRPSPLGAFRFPDAPKTEAQGPGGVEPCPIDPSEMEKRPKGPLTCRCDAVDVTRSQTLTGSGIYDIGSDICYAAVHAGVLKAGLAGEVSLEVVDAPDLFRGSTRNGITSKVDSVRRSTAFQFKGVPAMTGAKDDLGECPPTRSSRISVPKGTWTCTCPAVDPKKASEVVGSFVYSVMASDICTAAVHAGVLGPDTSGKVSLTKTDSPAVFRSVSRNGIKSLVDDHDGWGAFQFTAAPPPAVDPSDIGDCPVGQAHKVPKGTWQCACPAVDAAKAGRVVGTSVYFARSSDICSSAVHAGVLKAGAAATVKFERIDSPPGFAPSTQNGVTSLFDTGDPSYGAFRFPGTARVATAPDDLGQCSNWTGRLSSLRKGTWTCDCPAVDIAKVGAVTGTQVYHSRKTDLCAAAVHAGALQAGTASRIKFERIDSPASFAATTQNGITSQFDFGDLAGAVRFPGTAPNTIPDNDIGPCPREPITKDRLSTSSKKWVCSCSGDETSRNGPVTGTDAYYLRKSEICVAAVHAGVLKAGAPGKVSLYFGAPPSLVYRASTRNGITSRAEPAEKIGLAMMFDGVPHEQVDPADLGECPAGSAWLGLSKGTWMCTCPKTDPARFKRIFGSLAYDIESDPCSAALHAGVLKPNEPGRVTFEVTDSLPVYRTTTRNGLTSRPLFRGSAAAFQFKGAPPQLVPTSDIGECPLDGQSKGDLPNGQWTCTCPSEANARNGLVIGSGVYALPLTNICLAAVHAGVAKRDSGSTVSFEVIDSPRSFQSSTQNGITSHDAGAGSIAAAGTRAFRFRP